MARKWVVGGNAKQRILQWCVTSLQKMSVLCRQIVATWIHQRDVAILLGVLFVNDFNKETCEIDGEIIKLFTSFKVECKKYSNSERVTITQKMGISQNLKGVYHLDIQMYGVKDNKEYPLVGYYNLSNNILSSYSQNVTVSSKLNFDYIYVKCKFIDCNGETHNLLYKEEYSKLIK